MIPDATVLIVEDEVDVANTYRKHLEDDYSVVVTHSGEEALEAIDETIDVVLLDRRMPGMSGDAVLEEIREREVSCRIVMVTAIEPDTDLVGMDFDEYLVKPVTDSDLHEVVETMLARDEYDERVQEMVTLASKLATLELKLDYDQLEDSDEYDRLVSEFAQLRDEIELPDSERDQYPELTHEKVQALLESTADRR